MPTRLIVLAIASTLLASGCFASRTVEDDASFGGGPDAEPAIDGASIDAGPTGCDTSADCDDGLFCNGAEQCIHEWPARHCVPAELHPCSTLCDEASERCCPDEDGDHHTAIGCSVGGDCDDHDPDSYPGAEIETCGGGDNDCDPTTFGVDGDADGDGHARTDCCQRIGGADLCGDDCDDTEAWRHPGASEECDARDQDCDSAIDEGLPPSDRVGTADCDNDGYGVPLETIECWASGSHGPLTCPIGGWAYNPQTDCDDARADIHPDLEESTCDGRDDDCDGLIDRAGHDEDGDGFVAFACDEPFDCDDRSADVHPGAPETCGFLDHDCDPATEPGDADGDGHVAIGATCVGDTLPRDDCDDTNLFVNPTVREQCNARDDDCDGVIDGDDAAPACASWTASSSECVSGRCIDVVCAGTLARCDGADRCTADLAADERHCGSCAGRCASSACVAGACESFADVALVTFRTIVRMTSGDVLAITGTGADLWNAVGSTTRIGHGARFCYQTHDGFLRCVTGAPSAPSVLPPLREIGSSQEHGCALTEAGRVSCWGSGRSGEIGDGTIYGTSEVVPTLVSGLEDARTIAVGGGAEGGFACAVRASGRVVCWGRGDRGMLGTGDRANRAAPTDIALVPDATAVAAGVRHACAIDASGGVWCWGDDDYGQLGIGSPSAIYDTPQRVAIDDAVAIAAGGVNTCALRRSGELLCWGANEQGQIGDGTFVQRRSPVHVANGVGRVLVASTHSCLVRASGAIECWGNGDIGRRWPATPTPMDWTP